MANVADVSVVQRCQSVSLESFQATGAPVTDGANVHVNGPALGFTYCGGCEVSPPPCIHAAAKGSGAAPGSGDPGRMDERPG